MTTVRNIFADYGQAGFLQTVVYVFNPWIPVSSTQNGIKTNASPQSRTSKFMVRSDSLILGFPFKAADCDPPHCDSRFHDLRFLNSNGLIALSSLSIRVRQCGGRGLTFPVDFGKKRTGQRSACKPADAHPCGQSSQVSRRR